MHDFKQSHFLSTAYSSCWNCVTRFMGLANQFIMNRPHSADNDVTCTLFIVHNLICEIPYYGKLCWFNFILITEKGHVAPFCFVNSKSDNLSIWINGSIYINTNIRKDTWSYTQLIVIFNQVWFGTN